MRRIIAVLVLLPVLTACGSSSHVAKPKQPTYVSAQAVATKAGLTSCAPSSSGHPWADEVTCGDRAVVILFDTAAESSKWASSYLVNGLPSGAGMLSADRWGIACEQKSTCAAIKDRIGGKLSPDGSDG